MVNPTEEEFSQDLDRVRAFRAEAPVPDRARLAVGRQRLLEAASRRGGLSLLRRDWRLAAVGTAAAVTVAALAATQLPLYGDDEGKAPTASELRTGARDASELLRRAADTVAARTTPKPTDDQWVYTRTVYGDGAVGAGAPVLRGPRMAGADGTDERSVPLDRKGRVPAGEDAGTDGERQDTESWYRYADPEFENGKEGDDHSPRERFRFLAELPADPEEALAAVRQFYPLDDGGPAGGKAESTDWHSFSAASVVLRSSPMHYQGLARLYRALATLDGVKVVDGTVKDAAGRRALALYFDTGEPDRVRKEVLLDPETYTYLGGRSVVVRDHTEEFRDQKIERKAGDVLFDTAVVATALVDEEGQRP